MMEGYKRRVNRMGILLSDEEIEAIWNSIDVNGNFPEGFTGRISVGIAKAQAIKVLDELGKPCPHVHKILPNRPKRACEECMAEISAALEGK